MNELAGKKKEQAWKAQKKQKGLSKQSKQMLAHMNIHVLLTDEEMKSPEDFINQSSITFRRSYAQMKLLDLLDAVITYEGGLSCCECMNVCASEYSP